ncbi:MAG: sulfatase/phosphatase domain-containing protein, partial [Cyclobacteriaceae bacterium]
IARWTGRIKSGTVSDHISAFWDIMPTMADLLNVKIDKQIDGISFLPTLIGNKNQQKQHDHLYWEFHEQGGRMALRQGDWKLVQYNIEKNPPGSIELYNLKEDPSEKNDLSQKFPDKVKELSQIMLAERVPSTAFPFAWEKR